MNTLLLHSYKPQVNLLFTGFDFDYAFPGSASSPRLQAYHNSILSLAHFSTPHAHGVYAQNLDLHNLGQSHFESSTASAGASGLSITYALACRVHPFSEVLRGMVAQEPIHIASWHDSLLHWANGLSLFFSVILSPNVYFPARSWALSSNWITPRRYLSNHILLPSTVTVLRGCSNDNRGRNVPGTALPITFVDAYHALEVISFWHFCNPSIFTRNHAFQRLNGAVAVQFLPANTPWLAAYLVRPTERTERQLGGLCLV